MNCKKYFMVIFLIFGFAFNDNIIAMDNGDFPPDVTCWNCVKEIVHCLRYRVSDSYRSDFAKKFCLNETTLERSIIAYFVFLEELGKSSKFTKSSKDVFHKIIDKFLVDDSNNSSLYSSYAFITKKNDDKASNNFQALGKCLLYSNYCKNIKDTENFLNDFIETVENKMQAEHEFFVKVVTKYNYEVRQQTKGFESKKDK